MTINELIEQVQEGQTSVEDAARLAVDSLGYALEYFDPSTRAEAETLTLIRRAAREARSTAATAAVSEPEVMVMCSCGHEVPRSQVMSASRGTACPDCYDDMSD